MLFCLGRPHGHRLCVTEAAIDAMSLASIETIRRDTMYVSTGGGWSPATDRAIRLLGERPDVWLVAATDANPQGEAFVSRLHELASKLAVSIR
ncbi:toprim domain-containing protein [Chelativorans intermedius]|uniref:Toprim domain-containing protein n=1 Tax=Chelativorans intermedius TaxID=515947 RepID=A0ABV6DD87_9HYPH